MWSMNFWLLINKVNNFIYSQVFSTYKLGLVFTNEHLKMEPFRVHIIISSVLLFLISNTICASPIANLNEHRIRWRSIDESLNEDYQNVPLVFESSDFDGSRRSRGTLARSYLLGQRYKHSVPRSPIKGSDQSIIAFQPISVTPQAPRSYNRRPLWTRTPNRFHFQSPSELWNKVAQLDTADGKTDGFSIGKETVHDPVSVESVPVPEDLIRSDQSIDQDTDEDDLLNMFFSHAKTTPKYTIAEKEGKKTIEKQRKKLKTSQDINRNEVLHSDISDNDSEISFLTFDSVIQRRQCTSSHDIKDGKCKPRAKIN